MGAVPICWYCDTGLAGDWPGCSVVGFIVTLNSLPPSRSEYLRVLPPPEMTPLLTLSCAAGTPSCCEAMLSSVCRAATAAARTGSARVAMLPEPPPPPTPSTQESGRPYTTWLRSTSSSSATIIEMPVYAPWPHSG